MSPSSRPAPAGPMRASVIVPSYQGAHRLPLLLDALALQDPPFDWEVVVVLDGSSDTSVDVLASYRDKLPLRVLQHEYPRGTAAALTTGFAAARGIYLIRCDDDLTPTLTFVQDHVAAHEGRDDRGVIGLTRDVFPDNPYARVYGRPANQRALAAAYRRSPSDRWWHWAANNSLHRDAWDTIRGFDQRFAYGEDFELGYRLFRTGVELVIEPSLEVDHRGPATSAAARVPRAFVSGASRRLFNRVHPEAVDPSGPARRSVAVSLWSGAQSGMATLVRTRRSYARIGRWADRVLPLLPARVAERVLAFCVETAGLAGLRHGAADLSVYRDQKHLELTGERPDLT